jgi:hypothetical protein
MTDLQHVNKFYSVLNLILADWSRKAGMKIVGANVALQWATAYSGEYLL